MQEIIHPKLPPLKKQRGPEFHKKWFTLVELIVVVTILSILSTIWFVSYSWYLAWVRDTSRIRALEEIEKSMQVYSTNKNLPKPDNYIEIKEWSKTIAYQWEIWQTVIETIKYSKDWKDPKDKTYYTYYLTKNKKHFQLLSHLEEDPELTQKTWVNKAQASIDYETRYPYVQWAKLWILTTDENKPIQETISWSLDITDNTKTANLKSYLKTNESFTWSTNIEKLWLIAKVWWYWYSASWNTLTYVDYSQDETPTDWRSVDSNCDIADITIWSQTWAWCNSTIWIWKEWSWTHCWNYQGSLTTCTKVLSTDKEIEFNSTYWINNIWWKFYTHTNAKNTACKDWYHLPSDVEWTILENTLAWTTCRTWDGWQCDPIGWKNHTIKNATNNIVEALKLPLSWVSQPFYSSPIHRWLATVLWTSDSKIRYLNYGNLWVSKQNIW
jgi:type II secretory pathway pseudopilin PulG